jgi:antitoxin CcdA
VKRSATRTARKRPVTLTLSENLVEEAKVVTDNLSGVVECLLADYVSKERDRRSGVVERAHATADLWNNFAERDSSFAGDHATL